MIERILNAFGYVKKPKYRAILVTYRHLDGAKEVYGNVWYSTDKTGKDMLDDVFSRVKTAFLKANPDISEDQCPTIIIASITDLG
jgi:hypothetical protein